MEYCKSVMTLSGKTPLVELKSAHRRNLSARVVVRLEYANPASSVKDRIALSMIDPMPKKSGLWTKSHHPSLGRSVAIQALGLPRWQQHGEVTVGDYPLPESIPVRRRALLRAYSQACVDASG